MKKRLKLFFSNINKKWFYQRFKLTYLYIERKPSVICYILNHLLLFTLFYHLYFLLFNNILMSVILSYITSKIIFNDYILNEKIRKYEFELKKEQLLYMSKISLMIDNYNTFFIFKSMVENFKILKPYILDVINNCKSINESIKDMNLKYNDRYFNLFNNVLLETLETGGSETKKMLNTIYIESSNKYVQNYDLLLFKHSYKKNYLFVLITTILLPIFIKVMIPDMYILFISNIGKYILFILTFINIIYLHYIEKDYYHDTYLAKHTNNNENEFLDFFQFLLLLFNHNNLYQSLVKAKNYISGNLNNQVNMLIDNINVDKSEFPFIKFAENYNINNLKEVMLLLYQADEENKEINKMYNINKYISNMLNARIKHNIENYKNNIWKKLCIPMLTTVIFIFSLSFYILYYFINSVII